MNISKEIKFKAILQYFGCQIKSKSMGTICEWTTITEKTVDHVIDGDFLLFLKPLSKITDEDALEVAKVAHPEKHMDFLWSIGTGKDLANSIERGRSFNFFYKEANWIAVSQKLKDLGYDQKHPLLNGKTLKESGLATYE